MSNVELEMAPYFQRIKGCLKCSKKRQKNLLKTFYRAVEEFVAEQPEVTPEETEEFLGSPDEVAQGLMELLDPVEIEHEQKQKETVVLLAVTILTMVLVIVIVAFNSIKASPLKVVEFEQITIYAEGGISYEK